VALNIDKVAVLGSGVMGSAIAAHLANAGIPSLMLDIVPPQVGEGDDPEDPAFRNRFAASALKAALKARPAPFYRKGLSDLIEVGNFDDDFERIAEVDWIIEVVKEDLEIKRSVLSRVAELRRPDSLVSSNTSGISISAMAEGLDEDFRRHFLGTHFFNPPRYLYLLEIIPTDDTDKDLLADFIDFSDRILGKGIVQAKDTPNFVANRIGVFGMMDAIAAMGEQKLGVEEIDFLTGPIVGHPKSASFRTADLVGLDTFVAVAGNVYDGCPNDESRDIFATPAILKNMLEAGYLGDKTGGGFYKKSKDADGKRVILTLDLDSMEYREKQRAKFPELEAIRNIEEIGERLPALLGSKGRAAEFTWRTLSRLFQYCAFRIGEIADDPSPIDDGMRWGFGWELGPFQKWDALGFAATANRMKEEGLELPAWIETMLEKKAEGFYKIEGGKVSIWDPTAADYKERVTDPGRITLAHIKAAGATIKGNAGASLVDLGDGVACLEFHSKMNTLGPDIIGMVSKAVAEVQQNFDGLVVANQGDNFSVGANLMLVLQEALEQEWDDLNIMIAGFQRATMALKYAPVPTVVAPHGLCLGGGAEFVLHGQRTRASAETYIGLVEVGAGVLPAGGGCKELYLRNLERHSNSKDLLPVVQKTFETIGMAKVATSAMEARDFGFMRESDGFSINRERMVGDAKAAVISMVNEDWKAGKPLTKIPVMGRAGVAVIESVLHNMQDGKFISEHDRKIGLKVGTILCGGDLTGKQNVSEQYLLDLEREHFLSLLGERKTLERMQSILKTGKPLRN